MLMFPPHVTKLMPVPPQSVAILRFIMVLGKSGEQAYNTTSEAKSFFLGKAEWMRGAPL